MKERMAKEEEVKSRKLKAQDREDNNILVVDNLPSQVTEELMAQLFGQYPGFK